MVNLIISFIATFLITLVGICYLYKKWKWGYWSREGIYTFEPKSFMELGEQFYEAYFYFKKKGLKHGGTYLFFQPYFIPADLDLVKRIAIGDFDHFVNRGMLEYKNEKDFINCNLFNIEDNHWRTTRSKLSPIFTSGKIKMMFETVFNTSKSLEHILKQYAESNVTFEMKDVMARYTTDVILSVAFGIEAYTLQNPNSEFVSLGKLLMQDLDVMTVFLFLFNKLPNPLRDMYFRLNWKKMMEGGKHRQEVTEFFKKALLEIVELRENNNIHRKDFLHLLLLLKNRGGVEEERNVPIKADKEGVGNLSLNELISQCFLFYIGGFDTSSTALSFTLFELAQASDMQQKLRNEIHEALGENNGELSYDVLMKMSYLDKVVNESLRLHPPVKFLIRKCKKDYKVPGSDVTLKKDRMVVLPTWAIHSDPDFYPEPEKFDPERFSPEKKAQMHPLQHIPFGEGPRMCIGSRFAYVQMKAGLICILNKFRVTLNDKTEIPIKQDRSFLSTAVKSGIWFNVEEL